MAASSTGKRRPRKSSRTTKDTRKDQGLHLPSLHISGFRGIDELHIPKLGRVTLIAGDNSVGKTTVLEAVRLYAQGGDSKALVDLLRVREEMYPGWQNEVEVESPDGEPLLLPERDISYVDWQSLFHGRNAKEGNTLEIGVGDTSNAKRLTIQSIAPIEKGMMELSRGNDVYTHDKDGNLHPLGIPWRIKVTFDGKGKVYPALPYSLGEQGSHLESLLLEQVEIHPYVWLGPGLPRHYEGPINWDRIASNGGDSAVIQALEVLTGWEIEHVEVQNEMDYSQAADSVKFLTEAAPGVRLNIPFAHEGGPRVMIELKGQQGLVPLRSLGDGAVRLFALAMVLEKARDGFLLIDEAENGIHYSHHETYWKMVIETAIKNNIQVLATTHSFDCIAGFSRAVNSVRGDYGMLIRLDRGEDGKLSVAEYNEELLQITDEMGIEVR